MMTNDVPIKNWTCPRILISPSAWGTLADRKVSDKGSFCYAVHWLQACCKGGGWALQNRRRPARIRNMLHLRHDDHESESGRSDQGERALHRQEWIPFRRSALPLPTSVMKRNHHPTDTDGLELLWGTSTRT